MDPASPTTPSASAGVCCGCSCCSAPFSPNFRRSVKRKAEQPSCDAAAPAGFARVEVEHEVAALRETMGSQQAAIQDLSAELEEERSAAASAASEAMSMILRLQREKAEIQMEARQFRRYAEEKIAHDGREIAELEDLLFKRDQAVQALYCEIRAYKHRLLSLGVDDGGFPGSPSFSNSAGDYREDFDLRAGADYPSLRCDADRFDDEAADLEKHTPRTREHLRNLEQRIYELERTPTSPKGAVRDPPPENLSCSIPQMCPDPAIFDEKGIHLDDKIDRVYTVEEVHWPKEDESDYPKSKGENGLKEEFDGGRGDDVDIKKLYIRLQALEADRESMRQAIISMRTEKAQLVLLREIAQQMSKDMRPEKRIVEKKPSVVRSFSFVALIKWVISFLFWRKKTSRSRYSFGLSNSNVGLMQILDTSPQLTHWRYLTRAAKRGSP
ncbi:hypothetical protein AXF42_Ash007559 [Apostasia shenzhenica]|uniref:GTD-binding domain-containing protein n=1 Tax=Apostasia shenzhenica TaxID=1088818 RepID=A0A2I0A5T6_9ASPA|nr:hypothetical protein AXF42_Ash007559 [Apostasia shenzhenica]